ncbi:inositol monophosphatase family protein [Pedococcus sp. 5OH_020]|uniref:inositol monophosphatase family protein n=1 Tax=Pedococcus sp. 5OH_020 TaxID=2989814 RepID=UPI0022E9AD99|nr:inositol monophosphatase [Pedococcus sp. 5OH_020]
MDTEQVLDLMKHVAAEVITPRFRSLADGEVMEKNPGDLVTVADQESEVILTRELSAAFPGAFILGEERTATDRTAIAQFVAAEHAFTVDPVDGTKNFVHGSPDHAVMVSEVRGGETVRGWIWQPEHEVAWVAEKGAGVWRDGERVTRAPVADADEPRGVTSIWPLRGHSFGTLPPLVGSWVCCGVDYPRLMEGATDYILYARNSPWDHSPGSLMVREAGGAVGHPDGRPYAPTSLTPGIIVAADRATYAAVRRQAPDAFARR